jgi:outer membrane protein assembly factor BamB
VVVDDVLIQGDCTIGVQAFDLTETTADGAPQRLWSVPVDGCVESTPAVWDGRVYVGSRDGWFYALGDVGR